MESAPEDYYKLDLDKVRQDLIEIDAYVSPFSGSINVDAVVRPMDNIQLLYFFIDLPRKTQPGDIDLALYEYGRLFMFCKADNADYLGYSHKGTLSLGRVEVDSDDKVAITGSYLAEFSLDDQQGHRHEHIVRGDFSFSGQSSFPQLALRVARDKLKPG